MTWYKQQYYNHILQIFKIWLGWIMSDLWCTVFVPRGGKQSTWHFITRSSGSLKKKQQIKPKFYIHFFVDLGLLYKLGTWNETVTPFLQIKMKTILRSQFVQNISTKNYNQILPCLQHAHHMFSRILNGVFLFMYT